MAENVYFRPLSKAERMAKDRAIRRIEQKLADIQRENERSIKQVLQSIAM